MSPKQTRGGFHHEANGAALHTTFRPALPGRRVTAVSEFAGHLAVR